MTKKNLDEKKKRELAEEEEYLRQVDVPDSQGGGRKYVADKIKEEQKEIQDVSDTINNKLESLQHRPFSYRSALAEYGNKLLEKADLGSGWSYMVIPTDGSRILFHGKGMQTRPGVLMFIMSPTGNVYSRGIYTVFKAEIDSHAMEVLTTQAENTADSIKGLLLSDKEEEKKSNGGIYMP